MKRMMLLLSVALVSGAAYAQSPEATSLCTRTVHLPPAPPRQGGGNGPRAAAPPADLSQVIKVDKVREDLYLIHNTQNVLAAIGAYGSTVGVYVTDEGPIVIDSKNANMHDFLVHQIHTISDKPIQYLILTHSHLDHAGGAAQLQQMGITEIISSEDRALLERDSHPPVLPQIAYHGSLQLHVGGKEVDLREVCGHTAGDSIVYLPADRAVFVGDLVTTPDTLPQIVNYGDNGNWTDELRAMDVLAQMDFDIMVPGHGPVLTKPDFLKQREKMIGVFGAVKDMVRQGRTQQEILQTTIKQYNYGTLNGAGQVAGMIQEAKQSGP